MVLSGTGADGALGLRRIKEKGGIAIAQEPSEAEYDGMPRSAIATGMVDRILPVADIPAAIVEMSRAKPQLPDTEEHESAASQTERRSSRSVLRTLHARTGQDFSRLQALDRHASRGPAHAAGRLREAR